MMSQLGHMLVGVADSMMVGQLGREQLGAVSLVNSIFSIILMFGIGVSYAMTPLVAEADGNKNLKQASTWLKHGLVINLLVGTILFALVSAAVPLVPYLGQPEMVVFYTIPYLLVVTVSMVPFMVFQAFKQFAEGLSFTKQAMYITIGANLVNVFLNYGLIFGAMGFPELGVVGAGWATLISRVLMLLAIAWYVWKSKHFTDYWRLFGRVKIQLEKAKRMLKLGVPIGFQYIFEVSAFSMAAIMCGWLGTTALAAHQIAINLASITYMTATGIAAAATVRVGNQIGKGDFVVLKEVVNTSYFMGIGFMALCALVFILFRYQLATLYIDDPEVLGLAASLLIIAAFFQIFDGAQVVGLGALRGMSDVKIPTIITLFAYWIFSLPMGYVCAFYFDLGAFGIWIGLLTGLGSAALMLYVRILRVTRKKEISFSSVAGQ